MIATVVFVLCVFTVTRTQVIPGKSRTNDGDYNSVNTDGSFDFGYANKDVGGSYHLAHGNANKVVGGRFGSRDPATNAIKETVYTAGPRGFRAKGPNVHRKMDLDQRPRGPIGNKDDPYFDPNEDPSYEFKIQTRTYSKSENADGRGDVKGHYSYVDDVGERHDVSYIAGKDTGFHVSSSVPDSPNVIGSPFHRQPLVRSETKQRGKTAIQRGLDGSYRFISAGPDQRRTESSDSSGNVRGSYTFLDDKGVQRTVHYIAGPGIGYRIVKNSRDPFIPPGFPTIPSAYDPDFVNVASATNFSPDDTGADDVFKRPDGTAASGHVKPPPFSSGDKDRPGKKPGSSSEELGNDSGFSSPGTGYSPDSGSDGYGGSPGFGAGSHGSNEDVSYSPDEDASSYGGPPEFGAKPTKPPGRRPIRPIRPGRPTAKPYGPTKKPHVPGRPFKKPPSGVGGSGYDGVGGTNGYGSVGATHSNDFGSIGPSDGYGSVEPDDFVNLGGNSVGDDSGEEGPVYAVGFNIHSKPDSTIIHDEEHSSGKPGLGFGNKTPGSLAHGKPENSIVYTKPGATIIKNIGEDYFGIPPGVSVRAHVQSIDLYPYNSKQLSPSEALEKDKT